MNPPLHDPDAARTALRGVVEADLDNDQVADRHARGVWSGICEPGDGDAGLLVAAVGAAAALRLVAADDAPAVAAAAAIDRDRAREALERWRPRLAPGPSAAGFDTARRVGVRLIVPGDATWPTRVDDLGPHGPLCLWVRGRLPEHPVPTVAIVGARAATSYGEHVAMELSADLAATGVRIVSGAAYGIDGAAHRAALNAGGLTDALLAGGVDRPYPAGHEDLLGRITRTGAVISEVPCGAAPTKWRFLSRNIAYDHPMNVDLYLRLSIDRDGSDSIERQEADLRAWAVSQGLAVRKVWIDRGISGFKKVSRPEFDKAIDALAKGEATVLAVWKLDRLSRRGAGQVGLVLDKLEEVGGRIVFLKDSLDTSIPGHRMIIVMVSEQARAESENTRTRVTAKNASNVAQGLPVSGKRRYGFLGAHRPSGRIVNTVAHPEEAPQVQALFDQYVAGAGVLTLAKEMGWTPRRVRETLSNPGYAGYVVRGGVRYPAAASVERLVSEDVFEKAQVRLAENARGARIGPPVKHFASGIAKCGVCGKALVYRNSYLCLADLGHPTIKKSYLEGKIMDALVDTFTDPNFTLTDTPAGNLGEVNLKLSKLALQKAEQLAMTMDPDLGVTQADIAPALKQINTQVKALEAQKQQILSQSVSAQILAGIVHEVAVTPEGTHLLQMAPEAAGGAVRLRLAGLSIDAKRDLIKGMLDVSVMPGRGPERVLITPKKAGV
ncbi:MULTISPECIES: DNA-processing protein DprA [unclassified Microbacterium]|uniref:DNA-processing protein DprA n=1 Tax=unclassified Microbacterium TaxID=2609290 RepID=UPI00214B4A99|nr:MULTISPECIES: DNA-processing protein DprA [unclassified Microbacterium]MCR2785426.1 DNA-processing protein DprA [Microbacterium sp. zg.B96]WIM14547.1 DNA-processing protein DprA [Microbacterium sp. zg-B96]